MKETSFALFGNMNDNHQHHKRVTAEESAAAAVADTTTTTTITDKFDIVYDVKLRDR
jgi:hypothetical protein